MNRREMLAYAAGIIDREASIGYFSRGVKEGKPLTIEVKLTDKATIEFLHDLFGCGHIAFRPSTNKRWKDQWRWRAYGKNATAVLSKLSPYLRIKTQHL